MFDFVFRYVKKTRAGENTDYKANYSHKKVFSESEELMLSEYLLKTSGMFYGLTTLQFRRLACEFAIKNGIKVPPSWEKNGLAGIDWCSSFISRSGKLSLRKPEATSLARITSFNRSNIDLFFDNLEEIFRENELSGSAIWNLDESGCTTVHEVPRIIAEKGKKQIGQVTSRERGELVTVCGVVSAGGSALPLTFVFPRKNFRETFMNNTPEGSLGLVHPSGWMTSANFLKVLQHFVKLSHASAENKQLLIMDNHDSHLSIEGLEYARSNGVIILTLPPHTSNKTQPLDRSVFGPFKKLFSNLCNSWMLSNPAKTLTIYQIGELAGLAWDRSATPSNIKAGFRASGIWPFDRDIFTDSDFLPSEVTDRPQSDRISKDVVRPLPETPASTDPQIPHSPQNTVPTTPEQLRPYPKAPADRIDKRGGRKRGRSMIATSDCEMERIRQNVETNSKKEKGLRERNAVEADYVDEALQEAEDFRSELQTVNSETKFDLDDFVLVRFSVGSSSRCHDVFYVGCLVEIFDGDRFMVDFYRKRLAGVFDRPIVEDKMHIGREDIEAKLPSKLDQQGTARMKNRVDFSNVNFGNYYVK